MAGRLCPLVTLLVVRLSDGYQGYHGLAIVFPIMFSLDSNHLLFDLLNVAEQSTTPSTTTYPGGDEPNEIELPEHYRIAHYILDRWEWMSLGIRFFRYNSGYIPKRLGDGPIRVAFSMQLYQIIQIVQFLHLSTNFSCSE